MEVIDPLEPGDLVQIRVSHEFAKDIQCEQDRQFATYTQRKEDRLAANNVKRSQREQ